MRHAYVLAAVLLMVLVLLPVSAQAQIAVGQIILEDQNASQAVAAAVERALRTQNFDIRPISSAQYRANIYHAGTEHRREFNWIFLVFPLWPVVGITASETTVYVDSQVTTDDGDVVWRGSGEAKARTIWFSDFRYPSEAEVLPRAAERSLRGAGVLAQESTPTLFAYGISF